MKNQTDLIVKIVAILLALIACGVIASNAPQPFSPADPAPVPAVNVVLPPGTVVKTNGLPNAGEGSPAGGGAGAGASAGRGGAAPSGGGFSVQAGGRDGR